MVSMEVYTILRGWSNSIQFSYTANGLATLYKMFKTNTSLCFFFPIRPLSRALHKALPVTASTPTARAGKGFTIMASNSAVEDLNGSYVRVALGSLSFVCWIVSFGHFVFDSLYSDFYSVP